MISVEDGYKAFLRCDCEPGEDGMADIYAAEVQGDRVFIALKCRTHGHKIVRSLGPIVPEPE